MVDLVTYKDYIKSLFLHKKVHFKCDCLVGIDSTGTIIDITNIGSELVFVLKTKDGKHLKIGENTPNLRFQFI